MKQITTFKSNNLKDLRKLNRMKSLAIKAANTAKAGK